jgi:hypothetical protein
VKLLLKENQEFAKVIAAAKAEKKSTKGIEYEALLQENSKLRDVQSSTERDILAKQAQI